MCILRDNRSHSFLCSFDAFEQFELHPCAMQIVAGIANPEVIVALEIVYEKTNTKFECDNLH